MTATLASIVARWDDEVDALCPFPAIWEAQDVEVLRVLERTAVIDLGNDERKAVNLHKVGVEPADVIPYTPPWAPLGRGRLQLESRKKRRQRCVDCNLTCLEVDFYTPESSRCCTCQLADQRRRAAQRQARAERKAS